jgi:Rv2258c-like winged HTH domain
VVIGHRPGLCRALAAGPARAEELAERTQTSPRYLEEWLRGQAIGGRYRQAEASIDLGEAAIRAARAECY